ncbi:hypothetical protein CLOM_g12427 [Closterium sp. NIES-68]|nr:hypothetical protein CLOM_g12427 [Closterium sp. NIES-68]GJP72494.1 hypothetical protein CLOP_g3223 [Closterium sp. NIES-67]
MAASILLPTSACTKLADSELAGMRLEAKSLKSIPAGPRIAGWRCEAPNEDYTTRRALVAVSGAALIGALALPQSAQAARKKPPPQEKEEKTDLKGYQAKVYENMKRKEALKDRVAALKNQ